MINTIIDVIKKNSIKTWLITQSNDSSLELFFVKKEMVMRRCKDVTNTSVSIYNDFEKDGTKMRGVSSITIAPGMTTDEISKKIQDAYYAASFVCNPYFEFPEGVKEDPIRVKSSLFNNSQEENAGIMTEALFKEDTASDSFLNSAELFIKENSTIIKSSYGTDVSYTKRSVSGEFVTQCREPQDVETYQNFYYDNLEPDALAKKVKIALAMSRDRALAYSAPKAGKYRVILSGQYIKTIMEYYTDRAASSMIYPKYSTYKTGDFVQGDNITGDVLSIDLIADVPYSTEGVPMTDRTMINKSRLEQIHGNVRFGYYLGIEPIGYYESVRLPAGSISFSDMKKEPYLHIVNFSDFQMDSFSGHFGGEIRLAYLFENGKVTPVTGGSINGAITDIQNTWQFSSDMQVEENYEGPFALCLKDVTVAGC